MLKAPNTELSGIVHKKNENSFIICSPSFHFKAVWLTFFSRSQNKIFQRTLIIKQLWHLLYGQTETFLKIYFIVFYRKKRVTHRYWMTWGWIKNNIIFLGVNYHFNLSSSPFHVHNKIKPREREETTHTWALTDSNIETSTQPKVYQNLALLSSKLKHLARWYISIRQRF